MKFLAGAKEALPTRLLYIFSSLGFVETILSLDFASCAIMATVDSMTKLLTWDSPELFFTELNGSNLGLNFGIWIEDIGICLGGIRLYGLLLYIP